MNASKMLTFVMLTQLALMFLDPINVNVAQDLQKTEQHVKVRKLKLVEENTSSNSYTECLFYKILFFFWTLILNTTFFDTLNYTIF